MVPPVFQPHAEPGLDDAEVQHAANQIQLIVVSLHREVDAVIVPVEMGAFGRVPVDAMSTGNIMIPIDFIHYLALG